MDRRNKLRQTYRGLYLASAFSAALYAQELNKSLAFDHPIINDRGEIIRELHYISDQLGKYIRIRDLLDYPSLNEIVYNSKQMTSRKINLEQRLTKIESSSKYDNECWEETKSGLWMFLWGNISTLSFVGASMLCLFYNVSRSMQWTNQKNPL